MISEKFNVPSDLLVLNCRPSKLTENDLSKIVYQSKLFSSYDARFGKAILVSASTVDEFISNQLPTPEECGFNSIQEIKEIKTSDLKWDDDKFFI
jgi:hypothetical protein